MYFIIIFSNFFSCCIGNFFIQRNDNFSRIRVDKRFCSCTAFNTFFQRFNNAVAFYNSSNFYAADIVVAHFNFVHIAGKDAFNRIFRKRCASCADFYAVGINNIGFDGLAKHIIYHRFADSCTESFFRRTQCNGFNEVGMIHIIIDIHLAALEIKLRQFMFDNGIHIVRC